MHKRRERGHILNLVQNASRTLAFTSWLLEDFEGRLWVRRGRLDVYSTQTTTKQTPRSIQKSSGLNDRRERQATTIGEKVGKELVGELRFWVPKDRDPKVGEC